MPVDVHGVLRDGVPINAQSLGNGVGRLALGSAPGYLLALSLSETQNVAPVADHAALHVAGERMFVDCAGTTLEVVDGTTGEVRVCQLFVAALGASNYT